MTEKKPDEIVRRALPAIPHRYRVAVIGAALVACVVAAIAGPHVGLTEDVRTSLAPVIVVLASALIDALMVERRRRDGTVPALPDDERVAPTEEGE